MISIIEVGPRDGLQNVKEYLSTHQKTALIQSLIDAGFTDIEAGSFVRGDKVPSMADTGEIAVRFNNQNKKLWYLVPNQKGLESALENKTRQLAFFTAASESFNAKNIGMDIKKSVSVIKDCIQFLKDKGFSFVNSWNKKPEKENQIKLRLYISTVIGCPYEGLIKPKATLDLIDELMPLGFSQVSLGDTIGVGVPKNWKNLLSQIDNSLIKKNKVAMHCHNTYATALACVSYGLTTGVKSFDSSIGGLGGCPFAPGATGNLATEDLIYFLEKEGLKTQVSLDKLFDIFKPETTANLQNKSQVLKALKK